VRDRRYPHADERSPPLKQELATTCRERESTRRAERFGAEDPTAATEDITALPIEGYVAKLNTFYGEPDREPTKVVAACARVTQTCSASQHQLVVLSEPVGVEHPRRERRVGEPSIAVSTSVNASPRRAAPSTRPTKSVPLSFTGECPERQGVRGSLEKNRCTRNRAIAASPPRTATAIQTMGIIGGVASAG
jgi:hypothetical protein